MSRAVYRGLIALHPPAFQRRFAADMLWIFDDDSANGVVPLLADGFQSLTRQWLKNSTAWTVAGALLGGLVPIAMAVACICDWPHIRG